MASNDLWDDLDAPTREYLLDRAAVLHRGDIRACVAQLVVEARERHEHYLRLGLNTHTTEPEDLWGVAEAKAFDKEVRRKRGQGS